jgi:prefoldin subunit 5
MKFFRIAVLLGACLLVIGFGSCKKKPGGQYADAIEVMEKYGTAMEAYASDMDKVQDAKGVVAALNKLTDSMKALVPKMKEVQNKYPDWKDVDSAPEEIKPFMKKIEEVAGKMMNASMKAMQYAQDPEVQAAQAKLQEIMGGLE